MVQSDIRDTSLIIVYFLFLIAFTSWHDEHYSCRIKIPKWSNLLFFNQVKNGTVPLISIVTLVHFYLSLSVFIVIYNINNWMNLSDLLFEYFFKPYVFVVFPVSFIIDMIVGKKKKNDKNDLNEKKYIVNSKVKKKKKNKSKINKR